MKKNDLLKKPSPSLLNVIVKVVVYAVFTLVGYFTGNGDMHTLGNEIINLF